MTHRFFVPPFAIQGKSIHFPIETARQIQKVLRLQEGDRVIVLDNQGCQYDVRLHYGETLVGMIEQQTEAEGEPTKIIWLYLALTQREKFEWVLQKGTEVGCSGFVPMITRRSLVRDEKSIEKKHERWETILKEAAEQCGRGYIPTLLPALPFADAVIDAYTRCGAAFIPWVDERTLSFRGVLGKLTSQSLAILIGPEGGFTPDEVETAVQAGIRPVSLGPRILRMETAALAAITMAMTELGEMDQTYGSSGGGPAGP